MSHYKTGKISGRAVFSTCNYPERDKMHAPVMACLLVHISESYTICIGLRWRAEKEVISGKGQFICGNKHCDEKDDLASNEASVLVTSLISIAFYGPHSNDTSSSQKYGWRVNFCYFEAGENKQALVKLVTCERCADKLHYKRQKEKEQSEKREREENKRKRNRSRSIDETDNDCEGSKERRKRKKASISTDDHKVDDNFDEFLKGMFP
uniref:Uncharacterized protein n=1 Tax=Quercus lobata TaxID=97700 RepID=A0A7N2RCW4_QUELO